MWNEQNSVWRKGKEDSVNTTRYLSTRVCNTHNEISGADYFNAEQNKEKF